MRAPVFLSVEDVEFLHRKSIARYGGLEGVRDRGLLESAVAQPQNVYAYAQGDLFEVAAAYAFHLAEAQAFLDGNKRAAVAAALSFLEINGVPLVFNAMELYEAMIAIAEKRMSRKELAQLLRKTEA